ncbi:MAG: DNA replication/repair protein RecF [Actinomycetota bacterium]|nr:DNA replication/repair protein RecF [Actinomycetota bacterium]
MWVQALSLTDFRSYEQADMEFTPGVTAFIGLNGQGKTNIVEAIAYLSTLTSHRVSQDAPLVRAGTAHAVVRARVCEEDRSVSVDLQINPGGANKVRINRAAATRARDILGIVRAIVFAPEDLSLVRGDPGDRRRFLDDMTIQRHPRVAGVRADYDKVLRQRNALLKSAGGRASSSMRETLSAWDEQLIEFGTDIIRNRQDFIDDVSPHVHQAYERIAGVAQVNIRYKPSSPMLQDAVSGPTASHDAIHDALLSDLNARVDDEFRRGVTLVGPHRDELELELDGFPVKGYASHGESWSMALALRLGAADVLRADGVDPIIILDDVFAELDQQRRRHLTQMVHSSSQVFITAAVEEDVPKELDGARFAVVKGQVSRA